MRHDRRDPVRGLTLTSPRRRPRIRGAARSERRFTIIWHAAWTALAAAAAAALWLEADATSYPALAALVGIAAVSLLGAVLAQTAEETGAGAAVVAWAAAGAWAALLTGGTAGPLAALCSAADGRRRGVRAAEAAGAGRRRRDRRRRRRRHARALPRRCRRPPETVSTWLSLLALGATGLGLAAGLVALQGRVSGSDLLARETELSLREALDHQPQLLLGLYPGGRILEAYGEAPVGLETRDLPERNLAEFVCDADRAQVETALVRAAGQGSAEVSFVPAHDPQGWCMLTVRRMSDTRLIAALRDARAQRAREFELETARTAAEQRDAGKSRFLANMSHELRTPLNAIMGFSDIMRQRLFGPMADRYAEYSELIHESGSHLPELINDVLDMSKIEAERFELAREDFDARDAISAVLRLHARPGRPGRHHPARRPGARAWRPRPTGAR